MNIETIKKNLPMLVIVILALATITYLLAGNVAGNDTKSSNSSVSISKTASSQAKTTSSTANSSSGFTSNASTSTANASSTASTDVKSYTSTEVGKHSNSSSCWVSFEGNVFDVTPYISKHPGGNEILQACGQDLQKYNARHQGGAFDSPQVLSSLTPLKIGTLNNN